MDILSPKPPSILPSFYHTVHGRNHHLGLYKKPLKENGINYQLQLVRDFWTINSSLPYFTGTILPPKNSCLTSTQHLFWRPSTEEDHWSGLKSRGFRVGDNCYRVPSWWFQPIWKILVKLGHLPQVGVKIKNIWNHHLGSESPWVLSRLTVIFQS